jgi:hypothetical protein
MLQDGIVISPIGVGNVSTVMTEADVDRLSEAVFGSLKRLSQGAMAA